MTDDANPDEPKRPQVMAQFLQDWTTLWQQELQAQARDQDARLPEGGGSELFARMAGGGLPPEMAAAMDLWRAAVTGWAETLGAPPAGSRDRSAPSRSAAVAAAPDARDAEIERLVRRVDELEGRLAELDARLIRLEAPRRRRG
jgi:hypothetical protein